VSVFHGDHLPLTIMHRLNAEQQQRAQELGQRLHELTCQIDTQSAFLRKDLNALMEAFVEFEASSTVQPGSCPRPSEWPEQIKYLEAVISGPIEDTAESCVDYYSRRFHLIWLGTVDIVGFAVQHISRGSWPQRLRMKTTTCILKQRELPQSFSTS
jgi:hypothetical protein